MLRIFIPIQTSWLVRDFTGAGCEYLRNGPFVWGNWLVINRNAGEACGLPCDPCRWEKMGQFGAGDGGGLGIFGVGFTSEGEGKLLIFCAVALLGWNPIAWVVWEAMILDAINRVCDCAGGVMGWAWGAGGLGYRENRQAEEEERTGEY